MCTLQKLIVSFPGLLKDREKVMDRKSRCRKFFEITKEGRKHSIIPVRMFTVKKVTFTASVEAEAWIKCGGNAESMGKR